MCALCLWGAQPNGSTGRLAPWVTSQLPWMCPCNRESCWTTITLAPRRSPFGKKSSVCCLSRVSRDGNTAIFATRCRVIRGSNSPACFFSQASAKWVVVTKITSKSFLPTSRNCPNSMWCFSGMLAQSTANSRLKIAGCSRGSSNFKPADWFSCQAFWAIRCRW